ncbi:hypothetical protein ET495_16800 [Xylanimonas allomyrinae]|uniref:WxL domain-containing protein n=1 Tax=Xylanimonas allomyrinae TaxID=2509459 RepID=A0A4P6EPA3_9MICO|nr:hypothetical protein [Xylanimonas allomyrinae]QAY64582.1 hypothetical protein ET495_16800 [Xylanimonas allomyrinae]
MSVAYTGDGSVSVAGVASDDTLGNHPAAASRRPATHEVTDVQVVVGDTPASAAPRSVPLTSSGVTASFAGSVAPSADVHQRQEVHVRAKSSAGWGPWQTRWLDPLAAGPGAGHELVVADVQPGVLALEVPDTATVPLSQVTLTGADQIASGDLVPVSVSDGRGTSAGWVLAGETSDFGSSSGGRILAANLGWEPTAAVSTSGLGLVTADDEAPSVAAGPRIAPAADGGLSVPQTLAAAPLGASAGQFGAGGRLDLGIPGTARAGVYTGVLTLTLI